jgi:uncharacterized repeat protein (TIGR01451 family)
MSHQGRNGQDGALVLRAKRAAGLALLIAALFAGVPLVAQQVPPTPPHPAVVQPQPSPPITVSPPAAGFTEPAPPGTPIVRGEAATTAPSTPAGIPGAAVVDPSMPRAATVGAPVLDPDVQIVRFQGPPGLNVEVLAPAPVPVPIGDGAGIITVGLRRGIGYRLRVTGIVERPLAELYPVVEIVGHLHRPVGIDPGKYPVRIVFTQDDMDDTVDRGRLVTKVIYLEDPDQAIPLKLPKDQVSVLTLNPTEPPLRVASALGRPVAIVRLGGRRPTAEEIQGAVAGDIGLDWVESIGSRPCPFVCHDGTRCSLPCGPVCTPSPPPARPSLPRDEYLCDGGDRGVAAGPSASGRVHGIEPRDAVVRFDIGVKGVSQARVLPTNVVCVYAPRFAEVRVSTGTNQNIDIQTTKTDKTIAKLVQADSAAESRRLIQNQAAELARARGRATAYKGRLMADEDSNARPPSAYVGATLASTNLQKQTAELTRTRYRAGQVQERLRLDGIKSAEGPIIYGITQGASEAVRVWAPHSMAGVETPPDRPGLAVVKRVNAAEAEPGDTLTYAIVYRNMGNTPIKSVSIVDSLLPRLEYVAGTSSGPEGTIFTTAVNRVGATELHWVLPGVLAPGATGYVSFQAIVR